MHIDRGILTDDETDAGANFFGEALLANGNLVSTNGEREQLIAAVLIRRGVARQARLQVLRGDGGVGDGGAVGIDDGAGQIRRHLCGRYGGEQ